MNPQPAQTSNMPDVANGLSDTTSNAFGGISNSIADARTSMNSAVSDFSSKSAVDASSEFLESNTIVAKFAFIIVALIGFMLLFRLGAIILGYFFNKESTVSPCHENVPAYEHVPGMGMGHGQWHGHRRGQMHRQGHGGHRAPGGP